MKNKFQKSSKRTVRIPAAPETSAHAQRKLAEQYPMKLQRTMYCRQVGEMVTKTRCRMFNDGMIHAGLSEKKTFEPGERFIVKVFKFKKFAVETKIFASAPAKVYIDIYWA